MAWEITNKEIEYVIALPSNKRYEYFLKKVVDSNELWSLFGENGCVLATDDSGNILIPVWPHSKYAELCSTDDWSNCNPKAISLEDWITKWIPGLNKDHRKPSIFPTPSNRGIDISPNKLKEDLVLESSKYLD